MPQVKGTSGPQDWKSFVGRRRLNISTWMAHNRLMTFKDVEAWCQANSVEPPELKEIQPHLPTRVEPPQIVLSTPVVAPAPVKEAPTSTLTPAKKKRTSKKKAKPETD